MPAALVLRTRRHALARSEELVGCRLDSAHVLRHLRCTHLLQCACLREAKQLELDHHGLVAAQSERRVARHVRRDVDPRRLGAPHAHHSETQPVSTATIAERHLPLRAVGGAVEEATLGRVGGGTHLVRLDVRMEGAGRLGWR